MADPVVVACAADVWTKVATAVMTGTVFTLDSSPDHYMRTYRDTAGAAPTDLSDAVILPITGLEITNTVSIDVYVQPLKKAGSVVVST